MSLPTPRELEKLAKACRKAGISHFRCGDIEFTLGDPPTKAATSLPRQMPLGEPNTPADLESDAPTGDALLFWSVGSLPANPESTDQ